MKIFSSLLCLLTLWSIVNCTKKSDPEPVQSTKTEHITSASWKVDDIGIDQNRDGVIEQSALAFFPCLADNTITFKKDNTGTTDEGAIKCNTTDPQNTNINWNFADNETNIQVSNSTLTLINGKSKVVVLDAVTLSLSKDTTIGGFPGPYIVKLKH